MSIIECATNGDLKGLKKCIKAGININTTDGKSRTSLMYACKYGHVEIVSFLLENEMIDSLYQDNNGFTALHHAVSKRKDEIVHILWQHSKHNLVDKTGKSAIQYAIESRNTGVIKCVIKWRFKAKTIYQDRAGRTLLHCAVRTNDIKIVKLVLASHKYLLNIRDNSGKTPLILAVISRNIEIVKCFLLQGSIQVNLQDKQDYSAIWLANSDIMKMLIIAGADLEVKSNGEPLILHYAEVGTIYTIETLLQGGANPNSTGECGITALMVACADDDIRLVRLLLRYDAKTDIEDDDGCLAIDHTSDEEIKELLLQQGQDSIRPSKRPRFTENLQECNICMTNQTLVYLPNCSHAFCVVCLSRFESQKCALCRAKFNMNFLLS